MMLAQYLKEGYLAIDVYDANTRFLYGTTRIRLCELLRQGRPHTVIAKEAELCSPDSTEFRGSLKVILGNQGQQEKEKIYESTVN